MGTTVKTSNVSLMNGVEESGKEARAHISMPIRDARTRHRQFLATDFQVQDSTYLEEQRSELGTKFGSNSTKTLFKRYSSEEKRWTGSE